MSSTRPITATRRATNCTLLVDCWALACDGLTEYQHSVPPNPPNPPCAGRGEQRGTGTWWRACWSSAGGRDCTTHGWVGPPRGSRKPHFSQGPGEASAKTPITETEILGSQHETLVNVSLHYLPRTSCLPPRLSSGLAACLALSHPSSCRRIPDRRRPTAALYKQFACVGAAGNGRSECHMAAAW